MRKRNNRKNRDNQIIKDDVNDSDNTHDDKNGGDISCLSNCSEDNNTICNSSDNTDDIILIDCGSLDQTDNSFESIQQPYIYFINKIKPFYNDNLNIIHLLNDFFKNNTNYKKYLYDNDFNKVKILKHIHSGYLDEAHLTAVLQNNDHTNKSSAIHFYVTNNKITKLSYLTFI